MKRVNAAARTAIVCWDPLAGGGQQEEQEVSCYALRVRFVAVSVGALCLPLVGRRHMAAKT